MTREGFRHYKVGTTYVPDPDRALADLGNRRCADCESVPHPASRPARASGVDRARRTGRSLDLVLRHRIAGWNTRPASRQTTDDLAAGRYEIKLELFDAAGSLVNWTVAGIELRITDQDAPFGTGTITTSLAPNVNRILSGSDTMGSRWSFAWGTTAASPTFTRLAGM